MTDPDNSRMIIESIDAKLIALLGERIAAFQRIAVQDRSIQLPALLGWQCELERSLERDIGDERVRIQVLRVMNEVWRESRQILAPRPARVACLGPPGTFTHIMALSVFGSDV